MDKKLKVGLIGLGGICRLAHMPGYINMDNIEIAAVCDINPKKLESFREQFEFVNAAEFTDYRELLSYGDLDFVDICTPNYLHSIIAVEALNKGINVLCEKPVSFISNLFIIKNIIAEKNRQCIIQKPCLY